MRETDERYPEDVKILDVEKTFLGVVAMSEGITHYITATEPEPQHNGHHRRILVVNNAFEVKCEADCPLGPLPPEVILPACTSCGWKPTVEGAR